MKKLFVNFICLTAISCLLLSVMANQAFATGCTYFTQASVSVSSTGPASLSYTGNDSRSSNNLSPMEVNVWDYSPTSGFIWTYDRCGSNCSGSFSLPTDARFPDVSVVEYQGYWYAIVVYGIWNSGNSNYDADYIIYKYTPNSSCALSGWTTYTSQTTINDLTGSANAAFDNVIRIDAAGEVFAVIWDDSNNGIVAIAGSQLTFAGYSAALVNGATNTVPDVTVYPVSNSDIAEIYYTYNDASNTDLNVGHDTWDDLYNNAPTLTANNSTYQTFFRTGNYVYAGRPRIACANHTNTTCTDVWTVVSEYYDGTGPYYDIVGYTSYYTNFNNCTGLTVSAAHVYTDGSSNSPCTLPINADGNSDPCVAYEYGSTGIMIGWDCAYSGNPFPNTGYFTPKESIVLRCNMNGTYNSSFCINPYYQIVADVEDNNAARYLSISGRDYYSCSNDEMLYSYYNNPANALYYKDVPFSNCNLRVGKINNDIADNIVLFPNPFTVEVTITFPSSTAEIKIYDLMGNLLLVATGNEQEINYSLNDLTLNLPRGVYLLKLESENGITSVNKKLIKM